MVLFKSSNNKILNCTFLNTKWDNINLTYSHNNEISNCSFNSDDGDGIASSISNNSLFEYNTFTNLSNGISFHNSHFNIVNHNTIERSHYSAIILFARSSHNYFHHNNLIDNQLWGSGKYTQAIDWTSNNRWNTSTHGNYWSEWTSPDNNTDGIVDNPYSISGEANAKDHYPLVQPSGEIPVPPSNKPPKILTTNIETAYVGKLYSVNYTVTDPDTPLKDLIWDMDTNAYWLNFSSSQKLYGTPTDSDIGHFRVVLSVTDGNLSDFTDFTINVLKIVEPPQPGKGSVIITRTQQKFTKIQDAIDNASSGDTLRIWAGTYNENIVLNKTLKLIGNGSESSIIDAVTWKNTVVINADNCKLIDLAITGGELQPDVDCICGSNGIRILSDYNVIQNCNISDNHNGIYFNGKNNKFLNCEIYKTWFHGIYSEGSVNTEISGCSITKSGTIDPFSGIYLYHTINASLTNLLIDSNEGSGIRIQGSSNNINNCTIKLNGESGIGLGQNSTDNIISFNQIEKNEGFGILVESNSEANFIHHNNFLKNSQSLNNMGIQADDNGLLNIWNTSTEGNYWSDWTTPDVNEDGIVDVPYNISGSAGSKDYYPLANKSGGGYQPPIEKPKIQNTNIADKSYNVSINTSLIEIDFSKPMNRSSVEATLTISPQINYTLSWAENDKKLIIILREKLEYNTTYKITIGTGARDKLGNNLNEPLELEFTTEMTGVDEIPKGPDDPKSNWITEYLGIISALIVVIIVIFLLLFMVVLKRRKRSEELEKEKAVRTDGRQEIDLDMHVRGGNIADEYQYDEIFSNGSYKLIKELKTEALVPDKPSTSGPSKDEMLSKFQKKYKKGEISKETFESIKNSMGGK